MLWSFNDRRLWEYGSGLLASAGVASLMLATAAKSTASNFLAGLQIAMTEPIRIDDVVVVQGEWGRIEEITSSYVVIRMWDLRRLIVPLSWFIENAFANLTRESSAMLTYVVSVPGLHGAGEGGADAVGGGGEGVRDVGWHGAGVPGDEPDGQAMEMRCVMSAKDSATTFNVQCLVREEMMEWVKEKYPEAFPKMRYRAVGESQKQEVGPVRLEGSAQTGA